MEGMRWKVSCSCCDSQVASTDTERVAGGERSGLDVAGSVSSWRLVVEEGRR